MREAGSGYNLKYLFLIPVPREYDPLPLVGFSHPRIAVLLGFPFLAIRTLWALLLPLVLPVRAVPFAKSIDNWDGLTFLAFLSSLCVVKWVFYKNLPGLPHTKPHSSWAGSPEGNSGDNSGHPAGQRRGDGSGKDRTGCPTSWS